MNKLERLAYVVIISTGIGALFELMEGISEYLDKQLIKKQTHE